MKRNRALLNIIIALSCMSFACSEDWLEVRPKGQLDQYVLATEQGINTILAGAYSMLDGVASNYSASVFNSRYYSFGWESASSNWLFGSVRGLEANKGTDAGDSWEGQPIKEYSETSANPYLNAKWREVYEAIARCNSAIVVTNQALTEGTITREQADLFQQQARALRGWYHFEAWRMWAMIPYVDENTDINTVTNTEDIRDRILADLQEGTTLPNDMGQVGRFNGTVSKVLLAKAMMQMKHDYAGALLLLQDVKTNGTKPNGAPIGLAPTYGEIFDIENRNGVEAVYTVQYSVNDGSGGWNGGYGEVLNFPYKGGGGSPAGCCGFYQPTQEYVNSFRTSGGLPLLDFSYNDDPVVNDQGLTPADPFTEDAGPLDPRLDWSVGRRGIPYWDWGEHTGSDWIRDQTYAGPYSPKKQVYKKSQEGIYTETGNWTSGWTANGYRMIRYADVLLLLAECQVETGDLSGARGNINLVRARAANPAGFVKEADGVTSAADYMISEYPATGYPFDTQDNARLALYMERKLELGMEGHRYFDLNRWGITVTELTRILDYEKTMAWGNSMYHWAEIGPEDVTYPIPQRQIELSHGRLVQNR
jgi:starch-binding outer membrane protein, SusD/RagB family